VRSVAVDVGDGEAVAVAMEGADAAYYLVHSMAAGEGFGDRDRRLAQTFGAAASHAGVSRIIYVGGLGAAPGSAHLLSRQEVGAALAQAGVDVVELRAAVVFGAGGISFEMLRYLTERLPFMVCPRWVKTRIQPIALDDLLRYLDLARAVPPGIYEVGGAETTTYRDMIAAYAEVRGLGRRLIVDVPLLTPHLSAYWVDLVTPVDRSISHALIASLKTEVVVNDAQTTRREFTFEPLGVAGALAAALDAQVEHVSATLLDRQGGLADGVYTVRRDRELAPELEAAAVEDLMRIGGSLGWYGAAAGWWLRIALGRLLGERLRPAATERLEAGAIVDWWEVLRSEPGELVLRSRGWWPGEAWLGYRVRDGKLSQVASLRPKGAGGNLYWLLLRPVHRIAFELMMKRRMHPRGRRRHQ